LMKIMGRINLMLMDLVLWGHVSYTLKGLCHL
jgi:hypothetical protein